MKKNSVLHKMINKMINPFDSTKDNMESEFYLSTKVCGSPYDYMYCVSSYKKIEYPENISKHDKDKLNNMYDKLSKINFTRCIYYNIKNKTLKDNYNSNSKMLYNMKKKHESKIKKFVRELEEKNENTL